MTINRMCTVTFVHGLWGYHILTWGSWLGTAVEWGVWNIPCTFNGPLLSDDIIRSSSSMFIAPSCLVGARPRSVEDFDPCVDPVLSIEVTIRQPLLDNSGRV